jgi:hypothetical protein
MKFRILTSFLLTSCLVISFTNAQPYRISDEYLELSAGGRAPLYTTYTSAMERSRLYGDKGYKMTYDDLYSPLYYGSEHGGRFFTVWKINEVVVNQTGEFYRQPVVKASFSDMALLEYQPWPGLEVTELFFVYSSRIAVVDCHITNTSSEEIDLAFYPVFTGADSMEVYDFNRNHNAYHLQHYETKKRLISNLSDRYPYPTEMADIFCGNFEAYSFGGYFGGLNEFYNIIKTDFYSDDRSDSLNLLVTGKADFVSLHGQITLHPGESAGFRYFRGIRSREEDGMQLMTEINELKTMLLQTFIDNNIKLFSRIPRLTFDEPDHKTIYLSAFNLARGCMLPPTGETSHNFYVFSREPLWGWGHGHQVLHESLSMLAYAYLDPVSAQHSQRVYMEQQGEDGLIAYRHGPRGMQDYPRKGMPTTSAPFYNWINLEIFKVSQDMDFLEDAYESGVKYTNWLIINRDTDQDGTFEWGPYGLIENVRDWYNAVFQVSKERYLDVDKEDISDELECLDLSLMMVREMRSLAEMALQLERNEEARDWREKAEHLAQMINERMWHEDHEFFYSVGKADHSFYFMSRDLKRQEIIGFLPLWAGAVTPERAEKLVRHLTDPEKFWRKNGVPTLAADDEWYSPYVDYCCKWNGPVWLLWDYMVFDGLIKYGYHALAGELAEKMISAVGLQLSKNHNFWESYSPDNDVLNCPSNYIWDAIIARVFIDLAGKQE